MAGKGNEVPDARAAQTAVICCVVPRDLAAKLHEPLRRHFRDDPTIDVIVERRGDDRRAHPERRSITATATTPAVERRRIRNPAGRRFAERRDAIAAEVGCELPRPARPYAARLLFSQHLQPSTRQAEDIDTARVVTRIQAGDTDAFAGLYTRYFDRVYVYLRMLLKNSHTAEEVTQQVFTQVLEALPSYEPRRPFWVWLFTIMRNQGLKELGKQHRLELEDPAELDRRRDRATDDGDGLEILDWISDRDLLLFFERLPLAQREVLLFRYTLDLSTAQIADVLHRSTGAVDVLHHRALAVLRDRLTAVGRAPNTARQVPWRRRTSKIQVLRARRYALLRHS